eukprot:5783095-Lingulodinium_polyedra.AAC.1
MQYKGQFARAFWQRLRRRRVRAFVLPVHWFAQFASGESVLAIGMQVCVLCGACLRPFDGLPKGERS